MSFLELCRRMVGLDSTPGHGNLSTAQFVGGLCEQAGMLVEYHRETQDGVEQCNVIARLPDSPKGKEFLLQTHLDTADAGHYGHWTMTQSNPFNASIYNDAMYGLGTADCKLDFLCKFEALREFVGRPLRRPPVLVGTFGAETGMNGAIKLIRRKKIDAGWALIGEPTGLRLVDGGVGIAVVEILIPFSEEEKLYRREHDLQESTTSQSRMFSGKAAHSSDPDVGDSAISKMLEYLSQLPEGIAIMDLDGGINHNSVPSHAVLEIDMVAGFKDPLLPKISRIHRGLRSLELEMKRFEEPGFRPPFPTVNLGMIRTNESGVQITGSCRLPPSVSDADYERWMKQLSELVHAQGATFRIREYRKGFTMRESEEFLIELKRTLREMGRDDQTAKITVATEASVFHRLGIECIVFGPGQSVGNSHAPNEQVSINDLKTATEFYRRLIERFCL